MGGGGANSLNSPNNAGNGDFDSGKNVEDDDKSKDNSWTTPTYKTFQDYFIDFDITKDSITENDLSGTGSAGNPFVVHSTKGFLYIMNYSVSEISLYGKSLYLNCDIVLNDESFDKNGYPIGGDGVVYSWVPYAESVGSLKIYGNGHTISGLYFNDETVSEVGLFKGSLNRLDNFVFENFYIKGDLRVYGLCYNVTTAYKVIVGKGYIVGTQFVHGLSYVFGNVMEKCENHSNIICTGSNASGLVYRGGKNTQIRYCKNYGAVESELYGSGILTTRFDYYIKILNCENYGDIIGKRYLGGIMSAVLSSDEKYIYGCKNYGKIYGVDNVCLGGIIGYSAGRLVIESCENYGSVGIGVFTSSAGGIIGQVYTYTQVGYDLISKTIISNCKVEISQGDMPVAGLVGKLAGEETTLIVKNCEVNSYNKKAVPIIFNIEGFELFEMKNISLKMSNVQNETLALANIKSSSFGKATIENISINASCSVRDIVLFLQEKNSCDMKVNGVVVQANNMGGYVGNDFSAFNSNWKTGKIGLGKDKGNMFQSRVTKAYLDQKGYKELWA